MYLGQDIGNQLREKYYNPAMFTVLCV